RFVIVLRPPVTTLFPYTTLFRSACDALLHESCDAPVGAHRMRDPGWPLASTTANRGVGKPSACHTCLVRTLSIASAEPSTPEPRSEEHTSELQSRENLVCRLLLE